MASLPQRSTHLLQRLARTCPSHSEGHRRLLQWHHYLRDRHTCCRDLRVHVPVTQKVIEGFYNGITTSEIDTLAAETCAYMSQKHHDFSVLAARIAVSNLHKGTSNSFSETCRILHEYHDKQGRSAALIADDVWAFI